MGNKIIQFKYIFFLVVTHEYVFKWRWYLLEIGQKGKYIYNTGYKHDH